MIDVALARSLRTAGLRWKPATGDRFVVDLDELSADLFTISEMTIEAHEFTTGTELGFNGTTEWALDSVSADDSLWLPREDQLRTLLGPAFHSLTRRAADGSSGRFHVLATIDGDDRSFSDDDAENAYAHALLAYIEASLTV